MHAMHASTVTSVTLHLEAFIESRLSTTTTSAGRRPGVERYSRYSRGLGVDLILSSDEEIRNAA